MTPIEWLLSGDTGISSKTICAVMTGAKCGERFRADVPYDSADFGRCYRLLQHFPEWRARLPEVAVEYPMWGPMVAAWDELTALYEEALRNDSRHDQKLYKRMKALIDAGHVADGWTRTGQNSWEKDPEVEVGIGGGISLRFGR